MNCVSFFALHSFHHPLFLLVSSLILSFILVTDFGCILNLHLPLFIYTTLVFSLFTLRNSLPSIYGVIFLKVLSALFLLLQCIIQSSAYLTYLCPLRVSSLSSSLSIMLLSNGLSGPPCGTPTSVFSNIPLLITPALSVIYHFICF